MENFITQSTIAPKNIPPALSGKWLNDADKAFSYLSNHENEKTSWWRSMSMVLTLLKQAQSMVSASKKHIKIQEERIKELEKLLTTDCLTSIANRRGFTENFNQELDRIQRGQSIGGLIMMIDLDNFKSINDIYGHAAGDKALKLVAKTLHSYVRPMDTVARQGGDEFSVLLVNTTRHNMLERTQNLIKKLNNLSISIDGTQIPIRASVGLKDFDGTLNANNILDHADKNMYAQKQIKKTNTSNQQEAVL